MRGLRKCFESIVVMMWIITGCGIDGMFESEEKFWAEIVAFVTLILVAFILWGNRDGGQRDY